MQLTGAAIGAIKVVPAAENTPPDWQDGVALSSINTIAEAIWQGNWEALSDADHAISSLLMVGGSRSGGARPKLLITDKGQAWLAKFNRAQDNFDMAAVEWTCLQIARIAGLKVAEATIEQLGPHRYLKLKRFDISPEGGRYHLLSCNSLLKAVYSQDDPHQGRYEDIADLIRQYCDDPVTDLQQLLGQALINSALHNTDDHLRNFSLLHTGQGWQLSPAYDIVPDETLGSYHQLTLAGKPFLPDLEHAVLAGKALGVGKADSCRVAQRVAEALTHWPRLLKQAGVQAEAFERLIKIVR